MNTDRFCDDGAFRERRKTRRIIRNLYDTGGHKKGRYHVYTENGRWYYTHKGESIQVFPLRGRLSGSYCIHEVIS